MRTEEDNLKTIRDIILEKIDEKEINEVVNEMRTSESDLKCLIKIDYTNVWVTEEALDDMLWEEPDKETCIMSKINDKLPEKFFPSHAIDTEAIYINIETVKEGMSCVVI